MIPVNEPTVWLTGQSHGVLTVMAHARGPIVVHGKQDPGGGVVVVTDDAHELLVMVPFTVQRGVNVPTVV